MNGEKTDFWLIYKRLAEEKGWLKSDGTPNASVAERWLREQRLSPHHAGGYKVQLIPHKLHGNVFHTGGAAELRKTNKGN